MAKSVESAIYQAVLRKLIFTPAGCWHLKMSGCMTGLENASHDKVFAAPPCTSPLAVRLHDRAIAQACRGTLVTVRAHFLAFEPQAWD